MKAPGLLRTLAALWVVVPATLAVVEVPPPDVGQGLRRRYCPGCYSLIHALEPVEAPITEELLESLKIPTSLEESVLTPSLQTERRRPLDDSKVAARDKREERRVASVRRRGKPLGARPVCRGCFSGLMLTGRPAEGGVAEGTVPKRLSESGEDSSGGD